MKKITAIYTRQSVDRKDSISIESQVEKCLTHVEKGEKHRVYTDKGYSGGNTDRPDFQQLMRDIEAGLIATVIVYRIDRISRSILDFHKMIDVFNKHKVKFVSSTEVFDTSTTMGEFMLNLIIAFAQLERATIQQRVKDAYYTRSMKGFHGSGKAHYGYTLEKTKIGGLSAKMLVPDSVTSKHVQEMFKMYAKPDTSIGDIVRHFAGKELDVRIGKKQTSRKEKQGGKSKDKGKSALRPGTISMLLSRPIYVKADLAIYEFLKSQGADIVNGVEDFIGTNGCYLYLGEDADANKFMELKGQRIVLGPHEGLIDSDTWLKCRKKLTNNTAVASTTRKAKNTWLAGKIKCGNCDAALVARDYYRCRTRADNKSCKGAGTLRKQEIEDFVFNEMRRKMDEFKTLKGGGLQKENPEMSSLKIELAKVDAQIEDLIDKLMGASDTLMSYVNERIEKLHTEREDLQERIADMTMEAIPAEQLSQISNYLDNWADVSFDDRRLVADKLITRIRATSECINFEWRI